MKVIFLIYINRVLPSFIILVLVLLLASCSPPAFAKAHSKSISNVRDAYQACRDLIGHISKIKNYSNEKYTYNWQMTEEEQL